MTLFSTDQRFSVDVWPWTWGMRHWSDNCWMFRSRYFYPFEWPWSSFPLFHCFTFCFATRSLQRCSSLCGFLLLAVFLSAAPESCVIKTLSDMLTNQCRTEPARLIRDNRWWRWAAPRSSHLIIKAILYMNAVFERFSLNERCRWPFLFIAADLFQTTPCPFLHTFIDSLALSQRLSAFIFQPWLTQMNNTTEDDALLHFLIHLHDCVYLPGCAWMSDTEYSKEDQSKIEWDSLKYLLADSFAYNASVSVQPALYDFFSAQSECDDASLILPHKVFCLFNRCCCYRCVMW